MFVTTPQIYSDSYICMHRTLEWTGTQGHFLFTPPWCRRLHQEEEMKPRFGDLWIIHRHPHATHTSPALWHCRRVHKRNRLFFSTFRHLEPGRHRSGFLRGAPRIGRVQGRLEPALLVGREVAAGWARGSEAPFLDGGCTAPGLVPTCGAPGPRAGSGSERSCVSSRDSSGLRCSHLCN